MQGLVDRLLQLPLDVWAGATVVVVLLLAIICYPGRQ